jgi:hypothetical protein
VHRGFFGSGIRLIVAELGVDVVAGLGLVVDHEGWLVIRPNAVRSLPL